MNPPNTNGANGANGAGPYAPPGAAANGAVAPGVPLADRLPPGWSIAPAPRRPEPNPADESVDVGRLARTVARGWRALALGGLLGVLAGLAVALLVRPWYRGAASVLVRNANDPAGSLLSRFGLAGDVAGAAAGGALGGVLKSSLETEVQLLQSRELAGMVVDSLALQARVLEPRGVPARALFAPGPVGGAFRRRVVDFARQPDGTYRVLVTEDPNDEPWPAQLRQGSGVLGWAMLDEVRLGFELWRRLNGFPPVVPAPTGAGGTKTAAK